MMIENKIEMNRTQNSIGLNYATDGAPNLKSIKLQIKKERPQLDLK